MSAILWTGLLRSQKRPEPPVEIPLPPIVQSVHQSAMESATFSQQDEAGVSPLIERTEKVELEVEEQTKGKEKKSKLPKFLSKKNRSEKKKQKKEEGKKVSRTSSDDKSSVRGEEVPFEEHVTLTSTPKTPLITRQELQEMPSPFDIQMEGSSGSFASSEEDEKDYEEVSLNDNPDEETTPPRNESPMRPSDQTESSSDGSLTQKTPLPHRDSYAEKYGDLGNIIRNNTPPGVRIFSSVKKSRIDPVSISVSSSGSTTPVEGGVTVVSIPMGNFLDPAKPGGTIEVPCQVSPRTNVPPNFPPPPEVPSEEGSHTHDSFVTDESLGEAFHFTSGGGITTHVPKHEIGLGPSPDGDPEAAAAYMEKEQEGKKGYCQRVTELIKTFLG